MFTRLRHHWAPPPAPPDEEMAFGSKVCWTKEMKLKGLFSELGSQQNFSDTDTTMQSMTYPPRSTIPGGYNVSFTSNETLPTAHHHVPSHSAHQEPSRPIASSSHSKRGKTKPLARTTETIPFTLPRMSRRTPREKSAKSSLTPDHADCKSQPQPTHSRVSGHCLLSVWRLT